MAHGFSSCGVWDPSLHGLWDPNSPTRGWTCVPCIARWILKPLDHQGSPLQYESCRRLKILRCRLAFQVITKEHLSRPDDKLYFICQFVNLRSNFKYFNIWHGGLCLHSCSGKWKWGLGASVWFLRLCPLHSCTAGLQWFPCRLSTKVVPVLQAGDGGGSVAAGSAPVCFDCWFVPELVIFFCSWNNYIWEIFVV